MKKILLLSLILLVILFSYSAPFGQPRSISSGSSDNLNATIKSNMISIEKKGYYLNLTPFAVISGTPTNIQQHTTWWKKTNPDGSIKYGWNATIPNQNVADNLQAVALRVDSNFPLKKIQERLEQTLESSQSGNMITKKVIINDFYDIKASWNGTTKDMRIMNYNGNKYIVWDFRNITFASGQTLVFDPTILIADITTYLTAKKNTSIRDTKDMGFITMNDTSLLFYTNFDRNQTTSDIRAEDMSEAGTDLRHDNSGAAWIDTGCKYGGCIDISATSGRFSYSAPGGNFDNLQNFTIAWWQDQEGNPENNIGHIFDKSGHILIDFDRSYGFENHAFEITVDMDTTDATADSENLYNLYSAGWKHFAMTFRSDTAEIKFYVDGQETNYQAKTNGTGSRVSDTGDTTYIGNNVFQSRSLNGILDEFIVFNRTLPIAEVQQLYNQQKAMFSGAEEAAQLQFLSNESVYGYNTANITVTSMQPNSSSINVSITEWDGTYRLDKYVVGYWHFDNATEGENSTLVKDFVTAPQQANLSSSSAAGAYPVENGILRGAFRTDESAADSYLRPDSAYEKLKLKNTNFTVHLFVKPETGAQGNIVGTTRPTQADKGWAVFMEADNDIVFRLNNTALTDTTGINDDVWSSIAITFDNTSKIMRIYVNGEERTKQENTEYLNNPGSNRMTVGAKPTNPTQDRFNGTFDDLIIFNRTLPESEIKVLSGRGYGEFDSMTETNDKLLPEGTDQKLQFNLSTNTSYHFLVNIKMKDQYYTPHIYGDVVIDYGILNASAGEPPAAGEPCYEITSQKLVIPTTSCMVVINSGIDSGIVLNP